MPVLEKGSVRLDAGCQGGDGAFREVVNILPNLSILWVEVGFVYRGRRVVGGWVEESGQEACADIAGRERVLIIVEVYDMFADAHSIFPGGRWDGLCGGCEGEGENLKEPAQQ